MMSLPLKCMHMYKCLFVSVRENSAWTDRFPDKERKESERERESINTMRFGLWVIDDDFKCKSCAGPLDASQTSNLIYISNERENLYKKKK